MWALDHGVDQRIRNADESVAPSQLLRPAAPLRRTPGPLAATRARLLQQRATTHVSVNNSIYAFWLIVCLVSQGDWYSSIILKMF